MRRNKIADILVSFSVLLLLQAFLALQAYASADLDSFLEEVQKRADTINSLQADFVQEKHLALFTQPVIFTGKFAMVKPDRLRWEFDSPIPSVLILDKNQAIRCNDQAAPETISLSTDPIMKGVADQLWLWLGGGYQQLKDQYTITKTAELTLGIVPLSDQTAGFIDHIEIVFDEQTLLPAEVTIFDPDGDKTIIRFSNNRINSDIPDSFFVSCDNGS